MRVTNHMLARHILKAAEMKGGCSMGKGEWIPYSVLKTSVDEFVATTKEFHINGIEALRDPAKGIVDGKSVDFSPDVHIHTFHQTNGIMIAETIGSFQSQVSLDVENEKKLSAGYFTTVSGKRLVVTHPEKDQIDIDDIAHHLSMLCHWGGASRVFFSVAQHSVCVAKIAPQHLKKWALLHDAAEAYVGDLTRPVKVLLPEFKIIEKRILEVIAEKFNLPWPEPPELKQYDDQILKLEALRFMHHSTELHDGFGHTYDLGDLRSDQVLPESYIEPMIPIHARLMFSSAFKYLYLDDDGL